MQRYHMTMMIKIYYADISNLDIEKNLKNISVYRQEKLSKIKPILSKKQSLGAELLLNFAVKENFPDISLPLNIKIEQLGKPYCDELPAFFSLSHSGNFAACAICEKEIGIDIQKNSVYKENIIKRQFSVPEQEYIENAEDKDKAFTKLWSMKESYIKALGTGLHTALNSFSVWPGAVIKSESSGICKIQSNCIEDCWFSVCVLGSECNAPLIKKIEL